MIDPFSSAGKFAVATAAGILPMVPQQFGSEDQTDTARSSVAEVQQVEGSCVRLPPISFEIAEWFSAHMPIPESDAYISFKRKPQTLLCVGDSCIIPEWGVRVPVDDISPEAVSKAVVRRYLFLANKARKGTLTHEERDNWDQFLLDSDYADFCQRTAPLSAVSGICVKKGRDFVEVSWGEGNPERVSGGLAAALSFLDEGDEFSARVRFVDYKLSAISDITPLGKPERIDLVDLFGAA